MAGTPIPGTVTTGRLRSAAKPVATSSDDSAEAESKAILEVILALDSLKTDATRSRVLRYVAERFDLHVPVVAHRGSVLPPRIGYLAQPAGER